MKLERERGGRDFYKINKLGLPLFNPGFKFSSSRWWLVIYLSLEPDHEHIYFVMMNKFGYHCNLDVGMPIGLSGSNFYPFLYLQYEQLWMFLCIKNISLD